MFTPFQVSISKTDGCFFFSLLEIHKGRPKPNRADLALQGLLCFAFCIILSEVTGSGSSKAGNGTPEINLPTPGLSARDVFAFLAWNSYLLQPAQVFLKFKISI